MSRVDKFNPLKSSAIDQKRDAIRGGSAGKVLLEELSYGTVKEDALRYGLATDVRYQMSAGKEASIYMAMWKNHPIVLKAYRLWGTPHTLSRRKGHIRESSGKKTRFILGLVEDIASKEFDILQNCFKAGVPVPTPIGRVANYLTMRFIGDGENPALQLREVELTNPEEVLDQVLDDYLMMYRDAHYVHGDLSGYNILWWQERPWIIDVPQAITIGPWADMNHAVKILRRDIKNVLKYFEEYDIQRDTENIVKVFLDEYTPSNLRHFDEDPRDLMESGEWSS